MLVEPLLDIAQGIGQRCAQLVHPLAQRAVDQLQEQRPFPEARGKLARNGRVDRWQALLQQLDGLVGLHLIDADVDGIVGQGAGVAGGQQTGAARAGLQEGLGIAAMPRHRR